MTVTLPERPDARWRNALDKSFTTITVRVTDAEKVAYVKRARAEGKCMSEWIRGLANADMQNG